MNAPHTGAVEIEVEGERIPLRFTWEALSRLHGELGADWDVRVQACLDQTDTRTLAVVLEAATGRAAAWWLAQSPPLAITIKAVQQAIIFAYFGPGGAPEQVDPPKAANRSGMLTWFAALFGLGRQSGATPQPSGH